MEPDHRFGPKWTEHWGEVLPISYRLRDEFGDRWVRFHSFPQSKRYPDGESEFQVLLGRHNAVIDELVQDSSDPDIVNVITASWSDDDKAHPRDPEVRLVYPGAAIWRSAPPDAYSESWTHLYVGQGRWLVGTLDPLLRLVATYQTAGVIVTTGDLRWLYAPYDGGADVIAPSPQDRDRLRDRHVDWLSAHPLGAVTLILRSTAQGSVPIRRS